MTPQKNQTPKHDHCIKCGAGHGWHYVPHMGWLCYHCIYKTVPMRHDASGFSMGLILTYKEAA